MTFSFRLNLNRGDPPVLQQRGSSLHKPIFALYAGAHQQPPKRTALLLRKRDEVRYFVEALSRLRVYPGRIRYFPLPGQSFISVDVPALDPASG